MFNRKWLIGGCVILMLSLGSIIAVGLVMSNVEHPKYTVLSLKGNIEVRQYQPMIIASVNITGERKEALKQGFRLLADYIFGNNQSKKRIDMTAPVQQTSQKIAMTAPVQQQNMGKDWNMSFIMPSQYSINTLPTPNNPKIVLKSVSSQKFIVIRFSGSNSSVNIKQHEKELMQYIHEHKIQVTGSPKYAFYNPPWTLPFMRRNEVMLQIDSAYGK